MEEQRNIICLYWKGDFRGRDFRPSDVWRLYRNVMRFEKDKAFASGISNFYVLTNDMQASLPGIKIPLKWNYPGWWSKIELHRPDLPEGRMLYIDLDTTIIRSLKPIWKNTGDLVMFNNRAKAKGNPKIVQRYQAAIMLFTSNCEPMQKVYNKFLEQPEHWMQKFRSEQDIMGAWIPDQPTFPDKWLMKRADLKIQPKTIFITGQPKKIDFREEIIL